MENPIFIAIEGIDGSGKGTQAQLLAESRRAMGREVLTVSFPQYKERSSRFAANYLNNKYGTATEIHPDLASIAFALDRLAAKPKIEQALDAGIDVILDRYVASNLAHQGTKLRNTIDRHVFYEDIMELEFETLGLPEPQKSIVFNIPPDIAQMNVDKKAARDYTNKKRDGHEADIHHLELAEANYEELCRLYPGRFTRLECIDEKTGDQRSVESIRLEIEGIVGRL